MGKLVIFDIQEGSFEQGFRVTLRIGEDNQPHFAEISGTLPPSEIYRFYQDWQSTYRRLERVYRIILPSHQITNFSSVEECYQAAAVLKSSLNQWLNQPSVQSLTRQLLQNVGKPEQVRFILKTQNPELQQLPWHLWDVFEDCYPQADIALSTEYEPSSQRLRNPVNILAILGNTDGINQSNIDTPEELPRAQINVQADLDALEELLGVQVEPLLEPSREQLTDKLRSQPWDILFFAGHSHSQHGNEQGFLQINGNESLSLRRLRRTLRYAVQKGLKLAIFNSCDGLGLARDLADLRIPYIIVMREPVPDIAAQKFLRYFLTAFAGGELLYASVRQARERLEEELEHQYPCVSWLPVIFQNPAAADLKWPRQLNWKKIGLLALGAMALIGISAVVWRVVDEISFSNRFSLGDKILLQSVKTADKEAGVRAFWFKDYNRAVSKFQSSLQQKRNDPETLIYLNNAKIGNKNALFIAVAVPTDKNPDVAQGILRGVAQAQDEVNRQHGIDGKLLKVEIANDDNDPKIVQRVAHKLAGDQDILAVVGHNSSNASVEAADIYEANKLVMVSPTSTSRKLTEQNHYPINYIFRTVVNSTILAHALALKAKMADKTQIAICDDSGATDQTFEADFAAEVAQSGGKLIQIGCDFADAEFKPEAVIQRAINAGANSLLLDPHVDRVDKAISVAKANKANNRKGLALFGNPSMQTEKTLLNGAVVNDMILAVPWHPVDSMNEEFKQNATKLWGDISKIGWRTATSYDATQVIVKGLQGDNTREGVQKALSNSFSMDGVTGTIQFLPKGDRIGTAMLVQVERKQKASEEYTYVAEDSISSRISLGEKVLVNTQSNAVKQAGVQAFAEQNYNNALGFFQAFLKRTPNDPEALIYRNNAQAAGKKTFKIAVSVPIVTNLNVAQEILRGVAQAQDEINSHGGIQGHLLQVVIASDDNNPDIAQQLAKFFVKDSQILAVVGHNASDASVAAAPVYNDGALVMVSSTSFSAKLSSAGKYIFRTTPSIRFVADSLSDYIVKTAQKKNLAICVDEKAIDNQSFRDNFQSAVYKDGGNFVKINCDFSAPDFNPSQVMSDAINRGADGLVLAPHVDRINKALDLARVNKGRLPLFASPTPYTSETLDSGGADVNGMVLAVPWHPTAIPDNLFGQNAHKLWGGSVNWRTAMSYDAVVAIATGLQHSSTRNGLQQVLRSPSFSANGGATGKIEFLLSGDRNGKAMLVQIQPSRQSSTGYDFVPLNPSTLQIGK